MMKNTEKKNKKSISTFAIFIATIICGCLILLTWAITHLVIENPFSRIFYAYPYANIDIIKEYDNVERVNIGPFIDRKGNTYYKDCYVEHLVTKATILNKYQDQNKYHTRFDCDYNQNWREEFEALDYTYYCVDMRMYLTEEKDLKKYPQGYMDFFAVDVYKSEYDKVNVGDTIIDYRDCYFIADGKDRGKRIAVIDRFEVME